MSDEGGAGLRPARGLWTVLTASDPGLLRLRSAGTTIGVLVVTLAVLAGLASLAGQPVTVAMLGVVVAMISSIAVSDPTPRAQAVTVGLMVLASAGSVSLGALLAAHRFTGEAVFVGVAVVAVLLRRAGPRGVAVGMVAFISYFFALFLHATPAQLPALVTALAAGAAISLGMRRLLRPRRPDRDLRRILDAFQVRSGRVVTALADALAGGGFDAAGQRRLRRRLGSAGEAALMVEQQLDGSAGPVLGDVDDGEVAARVVDAQLATEHLSAAAWALVHGDGDGGTAPPALVARVRDLGQVLTGATGRDPARQAALLARSQDPAGAPPPAGPEQLRPRLAAVTEHAAESWLRIVELPTDPPYDRPDEEDDGPDDQRDDDERDDDERDDDERDDDERDDDGPDEGGGTPWGDVLRQAAQVGVASAASIVVGELLSPTRWFWAVIAAFVVFTGSATRGQTLSKGWQRILGTLAGVVAGVLVAAAVGGATVPSLVLIFVCLFLGFYLMRLSSGVMVFFVTTMLALLYGLLGQFSVGLLLLRLEETAAGAAIGVLVSFVVFPSSTREATRNGVRDVLEELDALLDRVAAALTGAPGDDAGGGERSVRELARELRDDHDALRTTARPLTHGLSGLSNRSGFRHVLAVLAACEHHARALARAADLHPGVAAAGPPAAALRAATDLVRADAGVLRDALSGNPPDAGPLHPAEPALDELQRCAGAAGGDDRLLLLAVVRHLRGLDAAVRGLAGDLGVPAEDPADGGPASTGTAA